MERQLWWNLRVEPEEQRVQYFFVVINDNREIGIISSRVIEQLAPANELQEKRGKAGTLHYKLMEFFSPKRLEAWQLRKIYDGNVRQDFRLYERHEGGIDSLESYVLDEIRKRE